MPLQATRDPRLLFRNPSGPVPGGNRQAPRRTMYRRRPRRLSCGRPRPHSRQALSSFSRAIAGYIAPLRLSSRGACRCRRRGICGCFSGIHPVQCPAVIGRLNLVPFAAEVGPGRVGGFDQRDLFRTSPGFDFLLPGNRRINPLSLRLSSRGARRSGRRGICGCFSGIHPVQCPAVIGRLHVVPCTAGVLAGCRAGVLARTRARL
jgi:hypothetical protein